LTEWDQGGLPAVIKVFIEFAPRVEGARPVVWTRTVRLPVVRSAEGV
jgi:hypothetical protein